MPYVSKSKFDRVDPVRDIKDLADAKRLINQLVDVINRDHGKLNDELLSLERSTGLASNAVIINNVSGGGSSGGGSIIVSNHRAYSHSLTAGTSSQFVPFSTAMTSSFVLIWRTDDGAGGSPGVLILPTDITATGFTVTDCLADCTIWYQALPLK